MATLKDICMIIAGLGTGTVAVKQTTEVRKLRTEVTALKKRPAPKKVVKAAPAPAAPAKPSIMECPFKAAPSLGQQPVPTITSEAEQFVVAGAMVPVGGTTFVGGSRPVSPPGAVPEPAAWLLMITGFGSIGLVARRKRAAGAQKQFS